MNTILKNAISSIQTGIEDYESDDERRLSSAVRNICAGIQLLFKEKLSQLAPNDILVKSEIVPILTETETVEFVGRGKKTVTIQQIQDRFKSLKISVDWPRFKQINTVRNDIEHYYTVESRARIREFISESFLIIRDFLTDELFIEPVSILGTEAWQVLLNVDEVYRKELKDCQKNLDTVVWHSELLESLKRDVRCKECHSKLVKNPFEETDSKTLHLCCSICNIEFEFEDIVVELLSDEVKAGDYLAMTDGGDAPITECFDCGEMTYVRLEDQCVKCWVSRNHTQCILCGEEIGVDEQDCNGLCGYHYYKSMKND